MSIEVKGLTHIYSEGLPDESLALEDISFRAEDGQLVGLIGHTGSGKSTLVQHLNGLLKPKKGHIIVGDVDITAENVVMRDIRRKIGLVFQYPEYQLFEETVYKDIAFGPGNMGLSKDEIDRRVREAAELVGLSEDMLAQSPFELSGGQKRRVAIAGVIAMEPKVLILDEPTAGLDPRGREAVLAQIRAYHERRGTTVILVSHSMEEIARNAGRIVVFCDSHILMQGTPREVFASAEELERVGLDVPQVTKIAGELRRRGLPIDPAVYTIEDLKAELLALKGGHAAC